MADIQALIQKTMQEKFDGGTLEKIVEERVEKLVEDAVGEAMKSWSPFGKDLKAMLESKLALNPESYNLDRYNTMVQKIVQQMLDTHLQGHLKEQVEKSVADILKPFDVSKPVKMSELVRDFMETTSEYEENMQGNITCHIEEGGSVSGYWQFYLDKEADTDKYRCEVQGMVNKEGQIFSLKISGEKIEKNFFVGPLYNFERRLFQLYANKGVLELDEDAVETSWDKY